MSSAPPRPPFALGIGVIGHRPDATRFPIGVHGKVEEEVGRIFALIRKEAFEIQATATEFYEGEPVLTAISAMAEGADRIIARSALTHGYALDVPLPFERSEYERDFEALESKAEFRDLLGKARAVFELPGQRADDAHPNASAASYEAAGLTVLAQCDILLTIWDGKPMGGRGGTADLLPIAARAGIPIVHLDPKGEVPTMLVWNGIDGSIPVGERLEDLPRRPFDIECPGIIRRLSAPPDVENEQEELAWFLGAKRPGVTRLEFNALMAFAGVRSIRWSDFRPVSPDDLASGFASVQTKSAGTPVGPNSPLAQAYGWADALAVAQSQQLRSAFVTNFLLAAAAVVLAVAPLWLDDPKDLKDMIHDKIYFVLPELVCIILLIINTRMGRGRKWHGRWVETRELAERFRAALPLWTVGLRPPAFVGAEPAWTGWYSRAMLRATGLRSCVLDTAGMALARQSLIDLLREQCEYNEITRSRMHRLNRRLEVFGNIMFAITAGFVSLFIPIAIADRMMSAHHVPLWIAFYLTAFAAAFPALATASYGIRVIGDFEGIARRAKRTRVLLQSILGRIEQEEALSLLLLRARARATAEALVGDIMSWRLVAEGWELNVPG